ncbi:hypothetical protein AQUCO_02800248v1 [Aquilegia coerulea]|uniref:Uncharacterized protein n=1 Tax=Aquilegia coerulea TaxID=218851 RepID=A0A2G5D4G5_AQUCA|nr:hypothetical protein AQUCO_02800248v1 [Aquilegia coerulea]
MSFQQMSSQIESGIGFARKDYQYYPGCTVDGFSQSLDYSSMFPSQHESSGASHSLNYQETPEVDSYCYQQTIQTLDHHLSSDDSSQGTNFSVRASCQQYCTLESSSVTGGHSIHNSPSSQSFSPNGSPVSHQEYQSCTPVLGQECQSYPPVQHQSNTYGSPLSVSCITDNDNDNDLLLKIKELESALLVPDSNNMDGFDSILQAGPNCGSGEQNKWRQMTESISRGDLKQVLVYCAESISDGDLTMAHTLIAELRKMVSVTGEPIQRVGAYLLEGLVARLASSGSSIYKSLKCSEPTSSELLSYMHLLYEVCPFFKFGYMSANGAIAEAVKDESRIHIIDFQIAQGSQWVSLIQALGARPGGAPYVRITGIDDSQSAYARGGGLNIVGQRLSKLAESCNVPFEFNAAAMSGCAVQLGNLAIRRGETIAVNFPFMLHHMPDESVSTENHRDRLLRLVKSLGPKVVTLVEQESNTNTAPFLQRFIETLSYYTSMFESIDVTLPREHKERINVEQHCLARDIVNIIACEGPERVERHELLGKWRVRFAMAGFTPYPLSSVVNSTIKDLLENYCEYYRLEERNGALYLGWKNKALVSSSAWI